MVDKRIIIETGFGNVRDAWERTTPSEIFVTGVRNQGRDSGAELHRRRTIYHRAGDDRGVGSRSWETATETRGEIRRAA